MSNESRPSTKIDFTTGLDVATRPATKLDFTTGLDVAPRPRVMPGPATTALSVKAGREAGMTPRGGSTPIDGRRLRARGATTQMNLKVTASEKEFVLQEAQKAIQNPENAITTVGSFVVEAVTFYKREKGL